MARLPRFDIPNITQHIVQRGNNRLPCFLDDDDRIRYLALLAEAANESQCQLHAYVLMSNHVHLLVTPLQSGAVGRMMQQLGRCYVGEFNRRHGRTGTLWEGRYKSCLVDSDNYILSCYRYIELNPVRARIVATPDEYKWSSYRANALGHANTLLTAHESYLSLNHDSNERRSIYQAIVQTALSDETIETIRVYLRQQRALGSDVFQRMVEEKTQRFAGVRPACRPIKTPAR